MDKIDIRSLYFNETEELVTGLGGEKYRAKQVFGRINKNNTTDFGQMNIPGPLRRKLDETAHVSAVRFVRSVGDGNNTKKYLFELDKGTIIECVLMRYSFGNSVCISTQAGCAMACRFCASASGGLERDLTAGEIVGQVYGISEDIGERIGNIVLMGSGEPLENYGNVIRSIRLINDIRGANIGQRHITLSTCGITDRIYDLAEENLQINLAVSLHAPNDGIRTGLMPVNRKHPVDGVIAAARYYAERTKRRVTYEYAMIDGINDGREQAEELAGKIRNSLCHVNLIPLNDVPGRNLFRSKKAAIGNFADILNKNGIVTTVRRELGSGINAACGQLRNSERSKIMTEK